jgi:hypothetical protein
MHMDGDCNYLLTLLTVNKISYQIIIPSIKSNILRRPNIFLHHSYRPLDRYPYQYLTEAKQTLSEELEILLL